MNNAIYYQLAVPGATGRAGDLVWDTSEHFLVPSLTNFVSPPQEGFESASKFSGVRIRSATVAKPALVTVI